jgi:hypothetical protein
MAKKAIFGRWIVMGYYFPMSHTHSTVQAVLSRPEKQDDGDMGFSPDAQPKEADNALAMAHNSGQVAADEDTGTPTHRPIKTPWASNEGGPRPGSFEPED